MSSMKRRTFVAIAVMAAFWAALPAQAQYSLTLGDVTVHYSAVATTSLDPEVARRYAITRTPSRALLTVVVLREGASGMPAAVKARVRAVVTNADGRREELALREVADSDAISYLAEPRVADVDRLAFELDVTPDGSGAPIEIRFDQAFFPPQPR